MRPLQLLLVQSLVKVLLLHLNGRAAERLLAVDAAARLVQYAQTCVIATKFPRPSRHRAGSGARNSSASSATLRQSVLHGPTDIRECRSAAAVQLAWEVSMLIPELASAVAGLLTGVAPTGDQTNLDIRSSTSSQDGERPASYGRVSSNTNTRPTAMSSGIVQPSALHRQPGLDASSGQSRNRYGSMDGADAEGISSAFAASATDGVSSEMHEWMWPGPTPSPAELSAAASSPQIGPSVSARKQSTAGGSAIPFAG